LSYNLIVVHEIAQFVSWFSIECFYLWLLCCLMSIMSHSRSSLCFFPP